MLTDRSMDHMIILASNSPRRRELLAQIGLVFTVSPADVDESVLPGEAPEPYAVRLALDKARSAAMRAGKGIVIAADTIVVAGGAILGKPADAEDARRMLKALSGRQHEVVTGLAVMDAATRRSSARTPHDAGRNARCWRACADGAPAPAEAAH